nr:unnamed protein product [Spirometra erinaceieuropaei]
MTIFRPSEPTAADVVNCLTASQLAHIFKAYGEERFARRIANAIVEHRSAVGPIRTTGQLADLVASVVSAPTSSPNSWIKDEVDDPQLPHSSPMHVATRVFQALRIFVNNELNELCCGLETAHNFLKVGGRATVISFHSLEDRLVKWAFTNNLSGSKAGGLASQLAATSNGAAGSARLQRLLNQLQPQSDVVLDSLPTPKTAFWPSEPTAADVVNCLTASQLAHIFKAYGEERFARRIANAIVEHRSAVGPIRTTGQLADLVASVVSAPTSSPNSWIKEEVDDPKLPHSSPMHVATRVFQALRIFVNNELNELCCGLETAHTFLKVGGRATVISFHSLEDRLVKWAFTNNLSGGKTGGLASQLAATSNGAAGSARLQRLLNQLQPQSDVILDSSPPPKTAFWCQVNGVIVPSQDEVHQNKRSRSAKLRVAEKRNVGIL